MFARVAKRRNADGHAVGVREVAVCERFEPASGLGRKYFETPAIADPWFMFRSSLNFKLIL